MADLKGPPREAAIRPPAEADEHEYRLARIWDEKGKHERAIAGYERALAAAPGNRHAHVRRVELLADTARWADVEAAASEGLRRFPDEAILHKQFIRAVSTRSGDIGFAFAAYELRRVDDRELVIAADALLCCAVVRNEIDRLPYWLSHYRRHGVSSFLMIDNGSSDGTSEYLRAQPDVFVWESTLSFKAANFGSAWFEVLLQAYGLGHWCLTVDADELLYFPDCDHRTIVDLCRDLDSQNKRAFFAPLLDMYSDRPIRETVVVPGQPFEQVCAYFDQQFFHRRFEMAGRYNNLPMMFGGVRERAFGSAGDFLLSKVPLLKYAADVVLAGGQHWTSYGAEEIGDETGCLLHFKFFASFPEYALQEAHREEHADDGIQYKAYAHGVQQDGSLCLYHPEYSVRFTGPAGLEALGVMTRSRTELPPASGADAIPVIESSRDEVGRPFWSVMLTAFDRVQFLPQALESVLAQGIDARDMQIEVVHDGGLPPATRAGIEELVRAVGRGRIIFHGLETRAGHPEIFNACIRRARGQWVHLLHDDDWLEPGFYAALRAGIDAAPEVGMAMSRWYFAGDDGRRLPAWKERHTAGIIDDWLNRVAVFCCVQTPAIVVRRAAYEQCGGYWSAARSAFDWDMWKRLAARFPLWYEPTPLASFRQHGASESSHLITSGGQVADSRRSIELARQYLPAAQQDILTTAALRAYARHAIVLAGRHLAAGRTDAALANIREGLMCSRDESSVRTLLAMLVGETPAQGASLRR